MISLPSEIIEGLETGRISVRTMVRFDLDEDPRGLWTDSYEVTFEDVVYKPTGANMQCSVVPSQVGLTAEKVDLKIFNANPDAAYIISGLAWSQRPVTIFTAFMNEAGIVDHVLTRFSGFLDDLTVSDAAGDTALISASIESNNREMSRSTGRSRGDNDQRRIFATDGFFKHTTMSTVDDEIYWGRKGPQKAAKPKGLAGLIDKIF